MPDTDHHLVPLTNDRWGFDSNCFVCEPKNGAGLGIPFFHDTAAGVVTATFSLDERFSGAPQYVHGGLALAILDEAMAWATIAIEERFAVTSETTTSFERPVRLDREHVVRAWITATAGREISTAAEIVRSDGKRCAVTTARFSALDLGHAADATGATLQGDTARYASDGGAEPR